MKRLILLAVSAVSLAASAAWLRVGTVRYAGTTELVGAVAKVGTFTGNPTLAAMAAGSVAKLPHVAFFGPMRPGATVTLPLYVDDAVVPGAQNNYGIEYAVIYPVSRTKAQFMKAHPGCVETNGLVRIVSDDGDDESDELDVNYVGFSADGKWAAMSDKPEQVTDSLAAESLAEAASPFKDGVVGFAVKPAGMARLRQAFDAALKQAETARAKKTGREAENARKALEELRKAAAVFAMLDSFRGGVGVDANGVFVRGELTPVAGTELAKVGRKALPADPLAFAAPRAVVASATAEDCGSGSRTFAETWRTVERAAKKAGFDLSPFFALTERKGVASLALDLRAVTDFATNTDALAEVDFKSEVFFKDLESLEEKAYAAKSPAKLIDFEIKGVSPVFTPSDRYAATLPARAKKSVFSASAGSVYAAIRAYAPELLKLASEKERTVLAPLLATLPPEPKSGLASACWREGDQLRGEFRVSADEIRGLTALFNLGMAIQAATGGDDDDSDDEDECDESTESDGSQDDD